MASIEATIDWYAGPGDGTVMTATWVMDATDDTGVAVSLPDFPIKTFSCKGDYDTAAVLTVQSSNTDVEADYGPAQDAAESNADITFSASDTTTPKSPVDGALFIRPKITTNGSGSLESLTVTMVATKQHTGRTV